jgi:hypothetical protein
MLARQRVANLPAAGASHRGQAIGEHGGENFDHLAVAIVGSVECRSFDDSQSASFVSHAVLSPRADSAAYSVKGCLEVVCGKFSKRSEG